MALEQRAQARLVQGEDKNLICRLFQKLPGCDRDEIYNFTNASNITAYFQNADGSYLAKTKASGDVTLANNGNAIAIRVRSDEGRALLTGENLSIEVHVVDNTYLSIAQIQNALDVVPSWAVPAPAPAPTTP